MIHWRSRKKYTSWIFFWKNRSPLGDNNHFATSCCAHRVISTSYHTLHFKSVLNLKLFQLHNLKPFKLETHRQKQTLDKMFWRKIREKKDHHLKIHTSSTNLHIRYCYLSKNTTFHFIVHVLLNIQLIAIRIKKNKFSHVAWRGVYFFMSLSTIFSHEKKRLHYMTCRLLHHSTWKL